MRDLALHPRVVRVARVVDIAHVARLAAVEQVLEETLELIDVLLLGEVPW